MTTKRNSICLSTITEDMEAPLFMDSGNRNLHLDKLKGYAQKRSIKPSMSLPVHCDDEPAEVRAPILPPGPKTTFVGFDLKAATRIDEDDYRSAPGKALARRMRLYLIYFKRLASSGKVVVSAMLGFIVFLLVASTLDPFGDDCPMVPLFRICRNTESGRKSCLITANLTEIAESEKHGYVLERIIGHAVNNISTFHATLPLYRFHNGKFDHLFTTSEIEKNAIIDRLPQWTFESKPQDWILYCSPIPIPKGHDCALVRLVAPEGPHVYTSSDEELFYYRRMGYTFEKVLCFIKCSRT